MKNWIRIFVVCFVLVGGTAFLAYQSLNQFNIALNNLSASSLAIAKVPPIPFSNKTNEEQIPTPAPETIPTPTTPETISNEEQIPTPAPETIPTPATSTDLKLSFIFPQKNSEVYIGCTYQLSFQSSTTISSLETALIEADAIETVESIESGLARKNKIKPDAQSLDWKVGVVLPGDYYVKVSNINGVDLESYSKVFTISKMPEGISIDEKEKICKESSGSSR